MSWIGEMCSLLHKKRSATEIWISFDSRWLRAEGRFLGWPSIGDILVRGQKRDERIHCLFYLFFNITTACLARSMSKSRPLTTSHALMAHAPLIPQKLLVVQALAWFMGIFTKSHEFEWKQIRECPADLPLEPILRSGSGHISAQRDGCWYLFRRSWVSLIFSSWSRPSEKEFMVLSRKDGNPTRSGPSSLSIWCLFRYVYGMTSGWNGGFHTWL